MGLRSSINRNLTDIVELHEEILDDLHRVVPNSEYAQLDQQPVSHKSNCRPGHHRWRSLDFVAEDKGEASLLQHIPSMTAEPDMAAKAAQVFGQRVRRNPRFLEPWKLQNPRPCGTPKTNLLADEPALRL